MPPAFASAFTVVRSAQQEPWPGQQQLPVAQHPAPALTLFVAVAVVFAFAVAILTITIAAIPIAIRSTNTAITTGSLQALLNYRREAPHAHRAHPTEDHFLPLFFALGAGGFGEDGVRPEYISREVMYSMLAMDSFAVREAA